MNPIHEPCKSRGECYHSRNGRIGGRIGALKTNATWGKTPDAREARSRGGRKTQATWGKTPEAREARSRAAHNQPREAKVRGARKTNATWGKTPDAREARSRSGRIGVRNQPREAKVRGGHIGGRAIVENGQLARIAKGVPSTANGILFRSQTEASFYCVTQELGGGPYYEPAAIPLSNGRSYTPDFVLSRSVLGIPANVPIELKPARDIPLGNLPKAIEAGAFVVYWDELVEE